VGPTLLEDFVLREKIFHFDHERIPERIVHARGSAAHGYFELYKSLANVTKAGPIPAGGGEDAGIRALLDGGRRCGFGGYPARCARLRGQVLYPARQLGSGRQQHPGILHPGCD